MRKLITMCLILIGVMAQAQNFVIPATTVNNIRNNVVRGNSANYGLGMVNDTLMLVGLNTQYRLNIGDNNSIQNKTLTLNAGTGVTITGGTQSLTTNPAWTISLPQSIATAATPTFSGLTISSSATLPFATSIGSVTATEISRLSGLTDNVQTQLNSLVSGQVYKGNWNASTNSPTLTTTPSTNGDYYLISVSGTSSITGTSTAMLAGGRIISNGTAWVYQPPNELALQKAITLEKQTLIYSPINETTIGAATNGGEISTSNQTITIPNGVTGGQTYLQKIMVLSNYTNWTVGNKIYFSVLINENIAGASDGILTLKLIVKRSGSDVGGQALNATSERINATTIRYNCEYVILSGDTELKPSLQINTSPPTNSGSAKVLGLKFYVQNQSVSTLSILSDKFSAVEQSIENNSSSIILAQNNQKVYSLVSEAASGEALNGAAISITNETITIPNGVSGASTYLQKKMILTNYPSWAIGNKVLFSIVVSENTAGASDGILVIRVSALRSGSLVQNLQANAIATRIGTNTVRYTCEYTIQTGDTQIIPTIQLPSGSPTNSGATKVFSLAFYSQNSSLVYSNNEISSKFESQYQDLKSQITANTNQNVNNSLVFTPSYFSITGEGLSGGVLTEKGVSIPIGSGGNLSYRMFKFNQNSFSNYPDLVGKQVFFTVILKTSSNLLTTKTINTSLNVFRSTGNVNNQGLNRTNTILDSVTVRCTFSYIITTNDIGFDIYTQITNTATSAAVMSFEVTNIYYTITDIPREYATTNSYIFEKTLEPIRNSISNITGGSTVTRLIVKKDGSGDYVSPKLANDAISNSSASNWYEILVYPGEYTETEWIVKPYTIVRGTDKNLCWLKGSLPDSASDAQISNTSTIWLKKTARLENLKITAKNMRYPVHSEESGANQNAEHYIKNCIIEHYGNQSAKDWRTANPGSGLSASTVWGSVHAWGYGSGSGVKETFENTALTGTLNGFYVHTNKDFTKPNVNNFENTVIRKKGAFGSVIVTEALGSGQKDEVNIKNSEISKGFIVQNDLPWISQAADNQYANHAEIQSTVINSSNIGYQDNTRGRALRISSNSTSTTSSVRISGSAVSPLFGEYITKDGGGGINGYVYGYWDISGILVGLSSNVAVNNTIGKRLGNCSSVNKTLICTFESGVVRTITFNLDYTSVSNATILSSINSVLSSSGVASEYNSAEGEYYPSFPNNQVTLENNTSTGIPRWAAVAYNSSTNNVRIMTTTDNVSDFLGIAVENIPPNQSGRILTKGIFKNTQLFGLSGTISYGTNISLSSTVSGAFELSSSKVVLKGVATNWAER